jgi:hypothetical protein
MPLRVTAAPFVPSAFVAASVVGFEVAPAKPVPTAWATQPQPAAEHEERTSLATRLLEDAHDEAHGGGDEHHTNEDAHLHDDEPHHAAGTDAYVTGMSSEGASRGDASSDAGAVVSRPAGAVSIKSGEGGGGGSSQATDELAPSASLLAKAASQFLGASSMCLHTAAGVDLPLPKKIGPADFQLLRVVGEGAFGRVRD